MRNGQPKVLMFAPLCFPPAGSEAIATAKLLLAALEAGWEIDAISQSGFGQYYPTSRNGVWEPLSRIVHNIEGVKKEGIIERLPLWASIQKTSSLEAIFWSWKALFRGRRLFSKKRYDFILSRATPQYGHLPALILSWLLNIPWIAAWSDPMPPQKAPPPYGEGPDAVTPSYLLRYCSKVSRYAKWHIFPCQRLCNYMSYYMPELTKKSSVIPHIALKRFCTQAQNNKKFSFCHTGSLRFRDPNVFLEGVRLFLQRANVEDVLNIKFIGPPLKNLPETVHVLGLDKIVSIEELKTYEETQEIIANSTVLVVIEAPCEEGIFFPSKFVDFVQTGRPILAISSINGTLADILSTHGGGILADCRSPEAVANAINILYEEWRSKTLDEKYGSSRLFDLFNEKRVLGQYMELFKRLRE